MSITLPPRVCAPTIQWKIPSQVCRSSQAKQFEDCFFRHGVVPRLSNSQQAMIRSQSGPLAGVPFVAFPTSPLFRFDASAFRVLLLRRFWRPLSVFVRLPVWPSTRRPWPPAVACAVSGVLGRRGFALESAAARLWWKQEAGSLSTSESVTWTCLRGVHRIRGDLKLFREGDGRPGPQSARVDGAALARAAAGKRSRSPSSRERMAAPVWLFLPAKWVAGGRWSPCRS